jgi:hypothetical protein
MNNKHDEIKKLLSASRKMIQTNNPYLTEGINDIKKYYGILNEQDAIEDENKTKKINVAKSIEKNIEQDEDSKRDKQQAFRVSGGVITLHGKESVDLQLTSEEKMFFQETMDEFVNEVSDLADFGILNVYQNSVEWSGKIIEFDLEFLFTIGEENGVYINSEMMKIDYQSLELLNKLMTFYQKFKSKWAKVISNRKKTMNDESKKSNTGK